jgi:hypothetical protein
MNDGFYLVYDPFPDDQYGVWRVVHYNNNKGAVYCSGHTLAEVGQVFKNLYGAPLHIPMVGV